jgi:hypothetical protein
MPVRLSDLTRRERTVAVHFEGVDAALSVTYRPDRWTPASEARSRLLLDGNRPGQALALFLAERVTSWDLLAEDGTPVPLTEDALADVDIAIMNAVVLAVMEDMRPKSTDPKSSAASRPN